MDTRKLVPGDPRVRNVSAKIRGKTYGYIVGEPSQTPVATVVLLHGFPDIGFGWRYQVPVLMNAGYRVVVPDMLGYGDTDAPHDLKEYSLKSLSADIKELATSFVGKDGQIILGGHDWGGVLVWRVALWHPELIKGVFSVCTPFNNPSETFMDLEDIIARGQVRNFTYQLHLRGPEVETAIQGEEKIRQFLNATFGARGPNGEGVWNVNKGILLENLGVPLRGGLLSGEELACYTRRFMTQPAPQLRGPLNWYRTRRINFEEERPLAGRAHVFQMPALFVAAVNDQALPPRMAHGMDKHFKDLTREEVVTTHWALTEAPDATNRHILRWLDKVMKGATKASL